jgi:hypothetical protein
VLGRWDFNEFQSNEHPPGITELFTWSDNEETDTISGSSQVRGGMQLTPEGANPSCKTAHMPTHEAHTCGFNALVCIYKGLFNVAGGLVRSNASCGPQEKWQYYYFIPSTTKYRCIHRNVCKTWQFTKLILTNYVLNYMQYVNDRISNFLPRSTKSMRCFYVLHYHFCFPLIIAATKSKVRNIF